MTVIQMYPNINRKQALKKQSDSVKMRVKHSHYKKADKMTQSQLPKEILEFVKTFKTALSPLALVKALEEAVQRIDGMEKINLTSFKFGDFKIDSMLTEFAQKIAKNWNTAKRLHLKTAPELVEHVKNNMGESLLISKIDGLKKANLIQASELEELSPKAKEILLKDMEILKKNGYVLPDIRFKENIILDSVSGEPKLLNFASLKKAKNAPELNDFMNSVKRI